MSIYINVREALRKICVKEGLKQLVKFVYLLSKTRLQKYYKNLITIIIALRTRSTTFVYICLQKKNRIFHSEHLFTFCTRQPIARTTIAAIVRYRAIIRNIEWSKYKREVSAKGWLCPLPPLHSTPVLIFPPFPVGAVFAGELLVYTSWIKIRDKGKSPTRVKAYICILRHVHVCPYTYARHLASVSHPRDFSGVVSARRYRWASFVDG